jgi:hypothetical protein
VVASDGWNFVFAEEGAAPIHITASIDDIANAYDQIDLFATEFDCFAKQFIFGVNITNGCDAIERHSLILTRV